MGGWRNRDVFFSGVSPWQGVVFQACSYAFSKSAWFGGRFGFCYSL